MTIDRRMLLRGMGRAATAGVIGAALAAGDTGRPAATARQAHPTDPRAQAAAPWAAAQPAVVPRTVWQAAPTRRKEPARTATAVKAVFIHHTNSGNDYTPAEVPDLIRYLSGDHTENRDWDDVGYNFFVDRTGTIYEGRAGGIANPVVGAHTMGFNVGTVGVAAIGSFGAGATVPAPMVEAIAQLAAWKLGMYGVDPRASTVLVSTNDASKYPEGSRTVFHTISGHRDGYWTRCPGAALYSLLPQIRDRAAHFQSRPAGPASTA
ncbi:peptidoglycan recognition protein [Streptomyces sp. ISL-1]|uniref:peptidoglycan recognition protein family protein n=1 Tax=Streptomyces sp. ISL-1 TaxID=2817657 RepID=UPI001BE94331|nr:peptidoglycan recognition protein [Streptomyces sp. ISL-1]MBT2388577.1 peptidoglycan recognition protein [Streptomyces sp. ISL-1]